MAAPAGNFNPAQESSRISYSIALMNQTLSQQRYAEHLASDYWHQVSQMVKDHAGNRCQVCNSSRSLETHHRTYANIFNEIEHLGDLICLCRKCHGLFHGIKKPKLARKVKFARSPHLGFFRRAAQKLQRNLSELQMLGYSEAKRLMKARGEERAEKRRLRKKSHAERLAAFKARSFPCTAPTVPPKEGKMNILREWATPLAQPSPGAGDGA